MKNILLTCFAAVVLFSLSAALSLYLQNPAPKKTGEAKETAKGEEKAKEKMTPTKAEESPTSLAETKTTATPSEQLTKTLTSVKRREEALKEREQDAQERERRLDIIKEDVRQERAVLDSLRKQFTEEMQKLKDEGVRIKEKQDSLANKIRGLKEQEAEAEKSREKARHEQVSLEKDESANVARMAILWESMPSDKVAELAKGMASSGGVDRAAKILNHMKTSKSAKAIAEITDVRAATEILDKMLQIRNATPAIPTRAGGT
jgi:chromosome segregation ATPase